ncbi:ABC transporter substrate-binding protein, partial [Thermodesulfobacteriota bacterium]
MKNKYLVLLMIVLITSFTIGLNVHPSMAADKSKYGGLLKPNHSKQAGIIGDPLLIQAWNHEFVDFVLELIVRRSNDRFGEYDPVLCESWEVDQKNLSITYNLRKGMKFHDGTDFNAQAVKWNYDRYLTSTKPQLSTMKSVEAIDDHTVRVNFNFWDITTFTDFTRGTFIISPTAFEKNGA